MRPKKKKTSKSSSQLAKAKTEKEKRSIERTISRGIFADALRAERFSSHPGYVNIKIKLSLYNAMNQKEERLPGKGLDLLVSSIEEVDDLLRLMEKTIARWIRGEITS
jgi:hypothetical protein